MTLSNFQMLIATIANVFETYIIFRLMRILFPQGSRLKQLECVSYMMYFAASSAVYLTIGQKNSVIMLVSNIVFCYGLSIQYSKMPQKQIFAATLVIGMGLLAESVVAIALLVLGFGSPAQYDNTTYLLSQLSTMTICYIIVLAWKNLRRNRDEVEIPFIYWLAIILIPTSILFITAVFNLVVSESQAWLVVVSVTMMIGFNILVFCIFERLQEYYQDKLDKEILARQNNDYVKKLNAIMESNERIRMIRHNSIEHIDALEGLIKEHDNDEALNYLTRIKKELSVGEAANIRTGNVIVDSVSNALADRIQKSGIKIERKGSIPDKLRIEPFDLCVIFGNLLDNAIEAVEQLEPERRIIEIQFKYQGGALYLLFANPCDSNMDFDENMQTTKPERENHGLGLKSVRRSVARYPGSLSRFYIKDNWFYADILLYEPE